MSNKGTNGNKNRIIKQGVTGLPAERPAKPNTTPESGGKGKGK